MTARYRITDPKGAYMARNPTPQLLQLGADHNAAAVYGIKAPVYELLRVGTEIEFDGVPGPHLEPLNDEAREATAAYWAKYPNATLDPTRHMPLGQDPFGARSVEQIVASLLDKMDTGRGGAAPVEPSVSPDMLALLAGQKAMQEAMTALIGAMAGQVAPSGHGRGRAG